MGRNVADDHRTGSNEGPLANSQVLANHRPHAYRCARFQLNAAGDERTGQNRTEVTENAVMADNRSGTNIAMPADRHVGGDRCARAYDGA